MASADLILVVDDDPQVLYVLQRSLARLGYEVLQAMDGVTGYELAVKHQPKVIVSDIRMPGIDGHTLLRRLTAQKVDAAVIITSGHGTMDDVVDALRNDAVDYLRKPWTVSELVASVARAIDICDRRRATRRAQEQTQGEAPLDPTPADQNRLQNIVERLRKGEIPIPACPTVVRELKRILPQPGVEMNAIMTLIERDPGVVAHLLRMSNSPQYFRPGQSQDLRAVVGRVGLRQLQSLIDKIAEHHFYEVKSPDVQAVQLKIWRHAVARALSMRALAEMVGRPLDPDFAYVVGILLDVGASFLLWVVTENSATALNVEECLAFIDQNHEELGAAVLTAFNVEVQLSLLVKGHHGGSPPAPPTPYFALIVLGKMLAEQLTRETDCTHSATADPGLVERCLAELGVGNIVLERMAGQLRSEYSEILASVTRVT